MDKLFFYQRQMRAEVAGFNPYLKKDIEAIRITLGIPEGGLATPEEGDKWYRGHYQKTKGKPFQPANPWNWHLPEELVTMLDSFLYSGKPSRVNFDPEVPLDAHAMELIHKYGLPEKMVDSLKGYILKEKHNALAVPSAIQPIFIPINEGSEGVRYMVIVAGVDESTTREKWLDIWVDFQLTLRLSGEDKLPSKRLSHKVLLRDLTLWTWVKRNGKTVKQALDEWRAKHPEDKVLYAEDTVRKAVERIDHLMKPLSDSSCLM